MTLSDRVAALEAALASLQADVAEHDILLSQPQTAVEVARAETQQEVLEFDPGAFQDIEGLFFEHDTAEYSVDLRLYVSHLSSLATVGSTIGLSIVVDGVRIENTTPVTVETAAARSYGTQIMEHRIEEGSGLIEVKAQLTFVGAGKVYIADSATSISTLRALRL